MYEDVLSAIGQSHALFGPLALKGIVVKSCWDGDCSLSSSRMQNLHDEAVCFQDACWKHRARDDKYRHYELNEEEEMEENSLNLHCCPDFSHLKSKFFSPYRCKDSCVPHHSLDSLNFSILSQFVLQHFKHKVPFINASSCASLSWFSPVWTLFLRGGGGECLRVSNRFMAACEQVSSRTILHVKTRIHTLHLQTADHVEAPPSAFCLFQPVDRSSHQMLTWTDMNT